MGTGDWPRRSAVGNRRSGARGRGGAPIRVRATRRVCGNGLLRGLVGLFLALVLLIVLLEPLLA